MIFFLEIGLLLGNSEQIDFPQKRYSKDPNKIGLQFTTVFPLNFSFQYKIMRHFNCFFSHMATKKILFVKTCFFQEN